VKTNNTGGVGGENEDKKTKSAGNHKNTALLKEEKLKGKSKKSC